jgi:CheY-like chemotaxis protein
VRLPAAVAPSHSDATSPVTVDEGPELAPPAGVTRILVVDDNVDAAELLAEGLGVTGHVTRVAYDGPSALDAMTTFRPDVALLDIGLPVMDGYELAQRLKSQPGLHALRLIAITGYGQDADQRRCEAAGFDEHMVKPIQLNEVTAVIERLLADRG